MPLQILKDFSKLCCPSPLECDGGFIIENSGKVWESYVPIKGTFTFDGNQSAAITTIRILLYNGKTITRTLQPGQSFAFTGNYIKRIEAFVQNPPSRILFRHCFQELLDAHSKCHSPCCPEFLQCELPATYRNLPENEDFLLWQSTIPVSGFFEIGPRLSSAIELKVIIKRFNKPDLVKVIRQDTVIHSTDMKSLLIRILNYQGDPPGINLLLCLSEQGKERKTF
ncbi:MAG: hypothetical protein PWP07_748 [Epulopiscium sp.]|uniref:Endospore appendages core domain-containing protein n=1 Tax=Defluviitalea raffinosedens TaxID=1450156 RepID=A0A7C8HG27_9FIRM|nr:S-Ena type endospore appendage [Defluviitalea raffinosedens]KAE9633178.1 hypothetical protein GND95_09895 [Defluviitalea raffinosedens]MDK2787523.1 hypothetical protein [Candidatus Epulonipiscium sp.]